MTETETDRPVEETTDKSSSTKETPKKATSPVEERLIEESKLAGELPIPEKNDYWKLSSDSKIQKRKRRLLPFLKSQKLTEEELSTLRESVERAPGRAKVKLQELLNSSEKNPDLMMLFAVCSYRMVMNSSNRKGALEGLKQATKDAAISLISNGISLYNCEKFFDIYFEYLGRHKRFQVSTYKALGETVRQQKIKEGLEMAIRQCDSLLEEKKRVYKVLNQIKGRFKSSSYILPWEFDHIKLAAKKVELNEYRYVCGPAEARQLVVYVTAMLDLFARTPILSPLVDAILQLIPETTRDLYLRKASVQGTRAFSNLTLSFREGDMDRMRTLGKQLYKTSSDNLQQIANQHVNQSYEADPYFNLSRVTIMTHGLYKSDEQQEMLRNSIKMIKRLNKLDMSKERAFAQTAAKMESKLSSLLAESGGSSPKQA